MSIKLFIQRSKTKTSAHEENVEKKNLHNILKENDAEVLFPQEEGTPIQTQITSSAMS
jgi:hypothetical protein